MRKSIKLPEGRDFKGIWLSAERYLDTNLSLIEIIILSEVESFQKRGECYASNQHFADFLGISENRIKHIIPDLVERGYLDSVSVFNQEKQKKERKLSISDRHLDQSAKNSTYPSATNDTTHSAKNSTKRNTYISNTDISNTLKFRDTSIDTTNNKDYYSISKEESSVFQRHLAETGYFDLVDIHNKEQLANVLSQVSNLPSTDTLNDYIYTVMSRFADTYKAKRNHKHNKVRYEKLIGYAERLIDVEPMRFDGDKHAYVPAYNRSFSVFELERDELPDFVDGFFDYDLDGCDYSIHVFMKDTILGARFWDIMNKRAKIAL